MGCLNGLSFLKVKYKTKTGKQTNKPPMAMLCSWAWGSKVRSVGQHRRLVFSCCQMPRTTGVQMAKGCAELFTAFSRNANTSLFHPPFWHHYLLNSKSIAPALPSCCGSMFIFSRCASFMAFGLLSGADVSTCGLSTGTPYSIALTLIWAFAKLLLAAVFNYTPQVDGRRLECPTHPF